MVRAPLDKITRKKVNTLLIIDVHARDIVDGFVRESILNAKEFAWESQLRFYWDRDIDDCVIRQCTGSFRYGYEYMGLNGRLVITPLTDRCYMTLTQALTFKLGGTVAICHPTNYSPLPSTCLVPSLCPCPSPVPVPCPNPYPLSPFLCFSPSSLSLTFPLSLIPCPLPPHRFTGRPRWYRQNRDRERFGSFFGYLRGGDQLHRSTVLPGLCQDFQGFVYGWVVGLFR